MPGISTHGGERMKEGIITLNHNSGKRQYELLNFLVSKLDGRIVSTENDGGFMASEVDVVTTDSFTISPIFFPGGDIGKLSVCGSINDVVMVGAEPRYVTLSLVLEEGFPLADLSRILDSIKTELERNEVLIISGDTKVMERNALDKIIINTACLGKINGNRLHVSGIARGDSIVITDPIGYHGAAIMACRKNFDIDFTSDCRSLRELLEVLSGSGVHAMRDPTRGGLAQVLNEMALSSGFDMVIHETSIPVPAGVRSVSEILGINPLYLPNEGNAVIFCEQEYSAGLCSRLKEKGFNPGIIGKVLEESDRPRLFLKNRMGSERVLPMLVEELTPRIC